MRTRNARLGSRFRVQYLVSEYLGVNRQVGRRREKTSSSEPFEFEDGVSQFLPKKKRKKIGLMIESITIVLKRFVENHRKFFFFFDRDLGKVTGEQSDVVPFLKLV